MFFVVLGVDIGRRKVWMSTDDIEHLEFLLNRGGQICAKWAVGDNVVLQPDLKEKNGLRASEVAAVSFGPDDEGNYKLIEKKIHYSNCAQGCLDFMQ